MNYGVPYKGSKSAIAEWVVAQLPAAGCFVDLFAGGCAVTHAAMLAGKFGRCVANDITDAPTLFADAIAGKYADERTWISRKRFFESKDSDPYVRYCWSFGNNGRSYMYGREIEAWKRALHYARVCGDLSPLREFGIAGDGSRRDVEAHYDEYRRQYTLWWLQQQEYTPQEVEVLIAADEQRVAAEKETLRQYLLDGLRSSGLTQAEVQRRLGTKMAGHYTEEYDKQKQAFIPALDKDYNEVVGLHRLWQRMRSLQSLQTLQSLQNLQRLQSLERLERLQCLQSLQRLEIMQGDYRSVPLPSDCVVYCDIPYRNTDRYNGEQFDHEAFYDWAESQSVPVFIAEYWMPPERFVCVGEQSKRCVLSATNKNKQTVERMFVPKVQRIVASSK